MKPEMKKPKKAEYTFLFMKKTLAHWENDSRDHHDPGFNPEGVLIIEIIKDYALEKDRSVFHELVRNQYYIYNLDKDTLKAAYRYRHDVSKYTEGIEFHGWQKECILTGFRKIL